MRSSAPAAERYLHGVAGLDPGGGGPGDKDGPDSRSLGIGSYAELRDATGQVLAQSQTTNVPDLPSDVPATGRAVHRRLGRRHRRLAGAGRPPIPRYPATSSSSPIHSATSADSLRGLVIIELIAGIVLLALLTIGSWLILRRGLRPLEDMAVAAGSIHEGDMSVRVTPSDGRGEVGQLGLALNEMLDNLQASFAAQKESENKLRQFLADASHELRTPLTSIQGFAELFRLGVANEHVDQDVIMRRIEEESKRMRTLVDDLLLLARLDERRELEPTPVDLAVLAADACSDAVAVDPDRRITLDAPESVMVDGVQDHLRQAIANLVANALTHTPPGTAIEVSARSTGGHAQVTVRDHGPGLSDDALQHAFDRFWRADPSRVGPKAGLGLSIVAAIAESHHGTATAANHPDGGAIFTVDLPAGDLPAAIGDAATGVSSGDRGVTRRTPTPLGGAARDRGAATGGLPRPEPTSQLGGVRRSRPVTARSRLPVA